MKKYYYNIVPNKIAGPPPHIFTYESNARLEIGQLTTIKIGNRDFCGVVLEETTKPAFFTKSIVSIENGLVIPKALLGTLSWAAEYYACPLPLLISHALPGSSKAKAEPVKSIPEMKNNATNIQNQPLTDEQSHALKSILKSKHGTFLLRGITGSGKTRIYLELAKRTIQDNKSALILVPEISLTPQIQNEFLKEFSDVYTTHSNMSKLERDEIWHKVIHTKTPLVLIGPRSALFAPISRIGLIVVDEFHDQAYKQEQTPKFHATRLAAKLAKANKARLILGSATPPVSELKFAQDKDVPIIKLTKPALKDAVLPKSVVVDMRLAPKVNSKFWLSLDLKKAIEASLEKNEQILLYYNRRGNATLSICQECGWVHKCSRCHLPYTLHSDFNKALCHICGNREPIPLQCSNCKSTYVVFKGVGTKQIEQDIKSLFRGVTIARFDSDAKKHETVDARFKDIVNGKIQIIIGTQMITKGLDLPNLGLVGVVLPDISMNLPDFTSSERTFQLLYQVIGRVGRHKHSDKVIVQTYQPDNPAIKFALRRDYDAFYKHEINQRMFSRFPPFKHLMKVTCSYASPDKAKSELEKLKSQLVNVKDIEILGPVPAFHERINNQYRWQLVFKSSQRKALVDIIAKINPKWIVDLDPINLL